MFKVGDRVRRITTVSPCHAPFMQKGHEYRVIGTLPDRVLLEGYSQPNFTWNADYFELVKETDKKPHVHAELIKAWAADSSLRFQCRTPNGVDWTNCAKDYPDWCDYLEYRIKPEPKPDIVRWSFLQPQCNSMPTDGQYSADNIKATFDGETGKLKAVELI